MDGKWGLFSLDLRLRLPFRFSPCVRTARVRNEKLKSEHEQLVVTMLLHVLLDLESKFEYLTSKFTFFVLIAVAGATVLFSSNHILKYKSKISFKPRRDINTTIGHNGDASCFEHDQHSLNTVDCVLEPGPSPSPYKPSIDINTLLLERAIPNARLVRALGLTNTFVSTSPEVHHNFVRRALGMLHRAKGKGWAWVADIAKVAVASGGLENQSAATHLAPQDSEEHIIKFDTLVQNTTLLVVLVVLLGQDEGVLESSASDASPYFTRSDIECVARNITLLWGLSKLPQAIPPHILEELNVALGRLTGGRPQGNECNGEEDEDEDENLEGFDNPLDFVVPAWETLWRVVATMVAYAYASEDDDSANVKEALMEFMQDPTEAQFRRASNANAASASSSLLDPNIVDVMSIVTECMRLHPPSKHISRSKARAWWGFVLNIIPASWRQHPWGMSYLTRVKVDADVGALLRCRKIWGADAASFVPRRHLPLKVTKEQKEAMRWVFGYGKLRCVAEKWAPMAAGVVAGAIVERMEREGMEVVKGKGGIGGRGGWEGWSVIRKR